MLLAAWATFAAPLGLRIGRFEMRGGQPQEPDEIPYSWTHPDVGCDDLEVNGSSPGLVLGTIPWRAEPRGVYVSPPSSFRGVLVVPRVDDVGGLAAESLEALLSLA